jgi:hypothetical protein
VYSENSQNIFQILEEKFGVCRSCVVFSGFIFHVHLPFYVAWLCYS